MFKSINVQGWSHDGVEFDLDPVILSAAGEFAKSAASIPMVQEMQDFWNDYPKKLPEKFLYVRINILGAGEYWGSNLNGDFFPEQMLKDYHKTFMSARMYLHHDNDDPAKSIGKIIFAVYNDAPDAKRVEVLVAIDRNNPRAAATIKKIENGEGISVSMGCRVPFDRCSKCGNKASSRKEYCIHLKTQMNKLEPSGLRICAMNDVGDFFDVSEVSVPAEPSSGFLEKVASLETISSAQLAEMYMLSDKYARRKVIEDKKESAIEKTGPDDKGEVAPKIDAESESDLEEAGAALSKTDETLPENFLEKLTPFPLSDILGTAGMMGFKFNPQEYTFIVISKNSKPAARLAFREGKKLAEVPPADSPSFDVTRNFNNKVAELMLPWLKKRSMFPEFAAQRLGSMMNKTGSSYQGQTLDYPQASAIYSRYKEDLVTMDTGKIACILQMYPIISARLTGNFGRDVFYKESDKKSLETDTYITRCILKGGV